MKHTALQMEKPAMKGSPRAHRPAVLASCVLAGAILVAAPAATVSAPGYSHSALSSNQSARTAAIQATRLSADSTLTLHTTYRACGHTLVQCEAMPSTYAGLTLAELSAKLPDWNVAAFSGISAELERTLDLPCPEHYVLTLDDNTLHISRNVDDSLADVNRLHVVREGLSTPQLQGLMHGWIASPDQVESIVEDLES